MTLRSRFFASACALAFTALTIETVHAQPMTGFSGLLQGDYANINLDHGGPAANVYGVEGSGMFPLGWSGLNFQADASYHDYVLTGPNVNNWNFGGEVFWRAPEGLVGGTVGYDSLDHPTAHITHYGGFGEYYIDRFTLAVKGGGFSGTAGADGYYVGGQALGYLTPDFALDGNIDYYNFNHNAFNPNFHETDYTAEGEWLVSENMPVSVFGGYTYSEYPGANSNTFFVGLRFYANPAGSSPLVDRQRNGALEWSRSFSPTGIAF